MIRLMFPPPERCLGLLGFLKEEKTFQQWHWSRRETPFECQRRKRLHRHGDGFAMAFQLLRVGFHHITAEQFVNRLGQRERGRSAGAGKITKAEYESFSVFRLLKGRQRQSRRFNSNQRSSWRRKQRPVFPSPARRHRRTKHIPAFDHGVALGKAAHTRSK